MKNVKTKRNNISDFKVLKPLVVLNFILVLLCFTPAKESVISLLVVTSLGLIVFSVGISFGMKPKKYSPQRDTSSDIITCPSYSSLSCNIHNNNK